MQPRGLYLSDFKSLIQRNAAPDAIITYYQNETIARNHVSVFDRNKPRRDGMDRDALLGMGEEDHWRASHVCECSSFNGMIPMATSKGVYSNENSKFIEEPYRGALDTLQNLRNEGCLKRSEELVNLFKEYGLTLK